MQVKTWLWDSNAAFTTVLDNPTAYGFVDAVSYGGTNDFWGNNYHPSSAFAEISAYTGVSFAEPFSSSTVGAAQTLWGQGVAAVLNGTVW